jgi:hypothetical protein
MKQAFKPLGIAAAVAAATSGYVNAQPSVPNNDLGDLALVPYYTVNEGFVTGIHIVNTSNATQVVKFRFRRATDSMDALDFNVIMSPKDVYAGFLSQRPNGEIVWQAGDNSCTAPQTTNGVIAMPDIFRPDAETGYVEIIGMAEADNNQAISHSAKHVVTANNPEGIPRSCEAVRGAFLADGLPTRPGIVNYNTAWTRDLSDFDGDGSTSEIVANSFNDASNALKVSYFIQDFNSGLEFGDNAVMIADFMAEASMTNQEFGTISGDLNGFDYPDLNGAGPVNRAASGDTPKFDLLRSGSVLGAQAIYNEWSNNPSNDVDLDWVVTLPGQYTMLNLLQYEESIKPSNAWAPTISDSNTPQQNPGCPWTTTTTAPACDFRDQPVELTFEAYNREELTPAPGDRGLVVSPAPPGVRPTVYLPKEANVITFGDGEVFGEEDANVSADLAQPFGWVSASVRPWSETFRGRVCTYPEALDSNFDTPPLAGAEAGDEIGNAVGAAVDTFCTSLTNQSVPVIGFAAWARSVSANPDANYGRIIEHSYMVSS